MELRTYQVDIIDRVRALMLAGVKRILIQSPTGSGKTALTAKMLGNAEKKGMASLFNVHRRELVKQSIRTFHAAGVRAGVIAANFLGDKRSLIQIASVQTLSRRLDKIRKPRLIVWDEAHHIAAGSWAKIYAEFPDAFHVGLTATPERLDGKGLKAWFDTMIHGPSVAWLIENKYLAPYRLYAPAGIVTEDVSTMMGDFSKPELNMVADKPTITGDAIKHYLKYARGKRAVVFCVSIEHSKHVVEQFLGAGIPAAHVDGETDASERDNAIARFERGETLVLSNVELFGEGFDLPALEAAILLRPTQSLGLYLQQCGRVLRPSPGKREALILDHAGNCQRHGLPDEAREWSLEGRDIRRGKGRGESNSVKVCPVCFAAQFSGRPVCSFCGNAFDVQSREVDEVEGDLVEVDAEIVAAQRARRREQGSARSLDDLIAFGKRMGYKPGWAHHVYASRQKKAAVR